MFGERAQQQLVPEVWRLKLSKHSGCRAIRQAVTICHPLLSRDNHPFGHLSVNLDAKLRNDYEQTFKFTTVYSFELTQTVMFVESFLFFVSLVSL